ncbi:MULTISPECIES: methylmalonyl Co-A mutase-associated GTPase MeaB [unclassified Flavobacterium]|uniref:methylmalonyl Co-A mutase-associated GTPase MeaB n=1 Tax=unclassified Flavobacterium TaxID=196869 RepID=UPI000F86422D|nr:MULTISPECIES: methylmalonyl Co-A mutase-associated GTPase MeaB [unclassified Flavobacterium]RTY91049.1 methylmalonyl Co-A mutase-associated GTPase MeaB [Flavobacterium sp. RSP46]RTZ06868.1 methylmalonyl Co-A mutase-associated GTPase MeaB [Flavobacterium sp. GSP6]
MPNKKLLHSALNEKPGISSPEAISAAAVEHIQQFRKIQPSSNELFSGILAGNITALSRAITLVESTNTNHLAKANEVINACLPHANKSVRIGITGVPGVGKSTFIEAFGLHLTSLGKKVAVLAVDPSSTISHGSILGDKTRMEELVKDKNAYIRPSASGETLGGVARKTRETITLCEACGFDTILIETVGVGQSETAVHSMVDFFLLLKITGAGDDLQGIKRGIMEMADAIVINKADGDNIRKAQLAKLEFKRALHLFPAKKSGWIPTTSTCSSISHEGIAEVWETIHKFLELTKVNNYFFEKRKEQNQYWMLETINEQLKTNFYNNPEIQASMNATKKAVQNDEISPFAAAQKLLETYFKK